MIQLLEDCSPSELITLKGKLEELESFLAATVPNLDWQTLHEEICNSPCLSIFENELAKISQLSAQNLSDAEIFENQLSVCDPMNPLSHSEYFPLNIQSIIGLKAKAAKNDMLGNEDFESFIPK